MIGRQECLAQPPLTGLLPGICQAKMDGVHFLLTHDFNHADLPAVKTAHYLEDFPPLSVRLELNARWPYRLCISPLIARGTSVEGRRSDLNAKRLKIIQVAIVKLTAPLAHLVQYSFADGQCVGVREYLQCAHSRANLLAQELVVLLGGLYHIF